jgi:hypothetical protein
VPVKTFRDAGVPRPCLFLQSVPLPSWERTSARLDCADASRTWSWFHCLGLRKRGIASACSDMIVGSSRQRSCQMQIRATPLAKIMLQRLRAAWSRFKRLPSIKPSTVLPLILLAAAVLAVYPLLLRENARRSSEPEVPGWEEIDECGSLTSFDGTKTLDFESSHKVTLTEGSSGEGDKTDRKFDGRWSFDAEKERYTVSFKDAAEDQLVKPEDSSVCILAPGDVGAVNLRESWFGRIEN